MKGLAIFAVIGVIALFLVIRYGGYTTLDPAEQAQAFREQVNTGMTWEQVADVREPREYVSVNPNALSGQGMTRRFDRDQLTRATADDEDLPYGFIFQYRFGPSDHYDIVFSTRGEVVAIDEPRTARDLYEGQLYTPR